MEERRRKRGREEEGGGMNEREVVEEGEREGKERGWRVEEMKR